jgi:hypothetical protein
MNDAWHSGDIDAAKAELLAAGWIEQDATTWKAPDGSRHRGPAGAWRTMKRARNDDAVGITASQRATFDSENAAVEQRIADEKRLAAYDFDAEARRVCEAIGSNNGWMTVNCALREAYEAGARLRGEAAVRPSGAAVEKSTQASDHALPASGATAAANRVAPSGPDSEQ